MLKDAQQQSSTLMKNETKASATDVGQDALLSLLLLSLLFFLLLLLLMVPLRMTLLVRLLWLLPISTVLVVDVVHL